MYIFGKQTFEKRDDDTFSFANQGLISLDFGLLANDWVFTAFPALTRVDSTIILNPSKLLDYTELLNDKAVNPKKIKGIRIITDNLDQMAQGFDWQSRDSNGEVHALTEFPINMLSPMQFQSRVIDLEYNKGIIVTQNEFFVYKILPLTTVTMTFIYDDYKLKNLLSERKKY